MYVCKYYNNNNNNNNNDEVGLSAQYTLWTRALTYNKVDDKKITYLALKILCNQSAAILVYRVWRYSLRQGIIMISYWVDLTSVYSFTVGKFLVIRACKLLDPAIFVDDTNLFYAEKNIKHYLILSTLNYKKLAER